jgi:hypothetical protein
MDHITDQISRRVRQQARLVSDYQWFVPSADELSRAVASRVSADMAERPKPGKADATDLFNLDGDNDGIACESLP